MNKKLIWSIYIIGWIYFIFFDYSYSQDDHIFLYLVLGWIPFLALHFLWKGDNKGSFASNRNREKESVHELIFEIADKDSFMNFLNKEDQLREGINQANQDLQAFSESSGFNLNDIEEKDDYLKLTPEQMLEYENLKEQRNKILTVQNFTISYISLVEEINNKLIAGLPFSDAKSLYQSRLQTLNEAREKQESSILISKILGELIADARRKGVENIDTKELIKRVDAEIKRLSSRVVR